MTISPQDLEKIAGLAYLNVNESSAQALNNEINSIMDFVANLSSLDTNHVAPLFHPLALQQPARTDVVTEEDCIAELEAMAPAFEEGLYLVPKVLDEGA